MATVHGTKSFTNGHLTYVVNGESHIFHLWVMQIAQDHMLNGQSYQSKYRSVFYPRSYSPGDIQVTGRCKTEAEYIQLGNYLRSHQMAMVSVPSNELFSATTSGSAGLARMLQLSVPRESILSRGFVTNFKVTRTGVFNVAPQFQFNFRIIFDRTTTAMTAISNVMVDYYKRDVTKSVPSNPVTQIGGGSDSVALSPSEVRQAITNFHHPNP